MDGIDGEVRHQSGDMKLGVPSETRDIIEECFDRLVESSQERIDNVFLPPGYSFPSKCTNSVEEIPEDERRAGHNSRLSTGWAALLPTSNLRIVVARVSSLFTSLADSDNPKDNNGTSPPPLSRQAMRALNRVLLRVDTAFLYLSYRHLYMISSRIPGSLSSSRFAI